MQTTTAKPQVLLIEDNSVIARLVQSILGREGFEVHWFTDGDDALGGVQRLSPDIVLCDLLLPSIDGFEVLQRLQRDPHMAHVPFVIISSKGDAPTVRRGMNLGADDYLTKPFRPDELVAAVRARIRRRHVHERRQEEDRRLLEQERLVRDAFDPQSGLPTVAMLLEHLADLSVKKRPAGLLLVQIQSSERLRAHLGPSEYLTVRQRIVERLGEWGRLYIGGDAEFFVLVEQGFGAEDRDSWLSLCLESARGSFDTSEGSVHLVCFGGYVEDAASAVPADAVQAARMAAVEAREGSRAIHHTYTSETPRRIRMEALVEDEFERALESGQLHVHYQPQVRMDTDRVVGAEALVRWRRADGELLPPGLWVPIIEKSGLAPRLTEWVLTTACREMAASPLLQSGRLRLAVNVSGTELDDPRFAQLVARILDRSGYPPAALEIEITESAAMRNFEQTSLTMHRLADLGITIAIDDFGTGYSSLAYLKKLPVHALKIDRAFTRDLPGDGASVAIVENIMKLSGVLHLEALAEGVEEEVQRDCLLQLGCVLAQGYLFGHAGPLSALEKMVL